MFLRLRQEEGSDARQRGRFWRSTSENSKGDGSDAKQRVRFWCWVKRTVLMLNQEFGSGAG